MALREDVDTYLRSLYGNAVEFSPDVSPVPEERPSFGSMLEGAVDPVTGETVRVPAIQAVRQQRMLEAAPSLAEAEALSSAAGAALVGGEQPMGLARRALPMGMAGSGAPQVSSYMDALTEAQRQDALEAAIRRVGGGVEQLAEIQSRGLYRPAGISAAPSAVAQLQQRQAAVSDFLRQQRQAELDAAQLEATRALAAQRLRQPAERVPLETEAQRKEREASATRQLALAEKAKKEAAQAGKPKAVKPPKAEEKLDPAASKLRNEFNRLPEVRTFNDAESSYRRMQVAAENPSPAGDIALVFSFMKLNDPGSTVREGEQAQARNAAGVPDQVRNQYNRLLSGESLTAEQRKDFMTQGLRFRNVEAEKLNQRADFYADLAKRSNLKVEDILQRAPQAEGAAPAAAAPAAGAANAPATVKVRRKSDSSVVSVTAATADKLVSAGLAERVP